MPSRLADHAAWVLVITATRPPARPSTRYISHSGRLRSSSRDRIRAQNSSSCAIVTRTGQRRAPHVVGDVEIRVVDPHRVREVPRHGTHPLPIPRRERDPLLDQPEQPLVVEAAGRRRSNTANPPTCCGAVRPLREENRDVRSGHPLAHGRVLPARAERPVRALSQTGGPQPGDGSRAAAIRGTGAAASAPAAPPRASVRRRGTPASFRGQVDHCSPQRAASGSPRPASRPVASAASTASASAGSSAAGARPAKRSQRGAQLRVGVAGHDAGTHPVEHHPDRRAHLGVAQLGQRADQTLHPDRVGGADRP